MVRLTRIYTRTGDDGTTGLGDGSRVSKNAPRVEAIGAIDEANAAIGTARLHAEPETDALLSEIQNDLFDLGADLCVPETAPDRGAGRLRIAAGQVDRLERRIDDANGHLTPLESFILPGGSPLAAHLHLARTVVRRAERALIDLIRSDPVNPEAVRYVNRLSDLLFVLARRANDDGRNDVPWRPGAHR